MQSEALAKILNARHLGDDCLIKKIGPIYEEEGEGLLSFVLWPKDIILAKKSCAKVILCETSVAADYADVFEKTLIVCEDFCEAFSRLADFFENEKELIKKNSVKIIHQSATIDPSAIIGAAQISANVKIAPQVFIEDDVEIGQDCQIEPGVRIFRGTRIGKNCRIGANSVVGSSAFSPFGLEELRNLRSLGSVHLGRNVQIGALCTIDRGLFGATKIGDGVLIDNMVHVGHDSRVGQNVAIAGQSGLAGFVRIEDGVTLGGQVGIAPHVLIKRRARISAKSFVRKNVGENEIWSGNPALPHKIYLKSFAQKKLLRF